VAAHQDRSTVEDVADAAELVAGEQAGDRVDRVADAARPGVPVHVDRGHGPQLRRRDSEPDLRGAGGLRSGEPERESDDRDDDCESARADGTTALGRELPASAV
jgi:hypothetical protein